MADRISGGCACGAIRYESDAEPVAMLNCHCRDCQRAGGSAFGAFVVVPKTALRMKGEPRYYKMIGDAGRAVERGFCPTCGCSVAVKLERMPDVIGLLAASLDDPARFKPTVEFYTDRAWPSVPLNPDTQKLPQGMP